MIRLFSIHLFVGLLLPSSIFASEYKIKSISASALHSAKQLYAVSLVAEESPTVFFTRPTTESSPVHILRIYSLEESYKLAEIILPHKQAIDSLLFSPDGELLYVLSKDRFAIAEASSGKIIFETDEDGIISMALSTEGPILLSQKRMVLYNSNRNYRASTFKRMPENARRIINHPQSRHIAILTDNAQMALWKLSEPARPAFVVPYVKNATLTNTKLTYLQQVDDEPLRAIRYDLATNQNIGSVLIPKELCPSNSLAIFAPSTDYLATVNADSSRFTLWSLHNMSATLSLKKGIASDFIKIKDIGWPSADEVAIQSNSTNAAIFNSHNGTFKRLWLLAESVTLSSSLFTPSGHFYVAKQPSAQLLCSSLSGQYALIEPLYNVLQTGSISGQDMMVLSNQDFEFFTTVLDDVLHQLLSEENFKLNVRKLHEQLPPPSAALSNPEPVATSISAGYSTNNANLYLTHNQNFRTLNSIDKYARKVAIRNFIAKDKHLTVQVHLNNAEGIYVSGASHPDNWGRLLLMPMNSPELIEVSRYQVREFTNADSLPIALAFTCDASISMGEERYYIIQDFFRQLALKKKTSDALSLINYRKDIDVRIPLSTKQDQIFQELDQSPIDIRQGGSSMIDAISTAISQLDKRTDILQRAIVIFTDGTDNSSVSDEVDVISRAIKKGIRIFAIGFGDQVEHDYLKLLAQTTDGEYYIAYSANDFGYILDDIKFRLSNFYQISFDPGAYGISRSVTGSHLALIDIFAKGEGEGLSGIPTRSESTSERYMKRYFFSSYQKPRAGDIKLLNIHFVTGKTEVRPGADTEIKRVVEYMQKYPFVEVEIRGHTDNTGSARSNKQLSQERAELIKARLVAEGIDEQRITAIGFGQERPISSNTTEEGRALNRRTEFVIIAE